MLKKSIGVIVAHPDDEVLGFCGTMLKEIDLGNKVYVLFLSTGLSSRENNTDKKDILSLRQTALEVSKKIGVTQTIFEEFPDNNMDSVPLLSVVKKVEKFLIEFKINEIYTHYINDLNIDHQITAKAVLTAARPLPKNNVSKILSGEVLSSSEYTEFNQRFTDLVNERFNMNSVRVKKLLNQTENDDILIKYLLTLSLCISNEGYKKFKNFLFNF